MIERAQMAALLPMVASALSLSHGCGARGVTAIVGRTAAPAYPQARASNLRATQLCMCSPVDEAEQWPSLSLDQASLSLHSAAQAAAEQQHRLRKGDAQNDLDERGEHGDAASSAPAVYLVGVGPGDPELLTVKALRLMGSADLVLYDRLISPEVLNLVNPHAAMLYVGKEAGLHTRPQEQIHQLLLQFASSGRTVVRLKGGDPTVFGRGGEEMEYLERQGVPVQIVPGVTAAAGIAAALRVPLTHRDFADSVRFITGHARSECSASVQERYHWAQLADAKTTLVIYMGLSTLVELSAGLVDAGLDPSTPAVAVQDGTTHTQRVVAAPLAELASRVEEAQLRSPTLIIIGNVVSLLQRPESSANAAVAPPPYLELSAKQAEQIVLRVRRGRVDA